MPILLEQTNGAQMGSSPTPAVYTHVGTRRAGGEAGQKPRTQSRGSRELVRGAGLCPVMKGQRIRTCIPCLARYPRAAGAVSRRRRSLPAAVTTRRRQAPVCCCRSRCRICSESARAHAHAHAEAVGRAGRTCVGGDGASARRTDARRDRNHCRRPRTCPRACASSLAPTLTPRVLESGSCLMPAHTWTHVETAGTNAAHEITQKCQRHT